MCFILDPEQNRFYIHSFKLFQTWGLLLCLYSTTEGLKSILKLQIIVDLFTSILRVTWNRLSRGSFQENKREYAYCAVLKCEVCECAASQVFVWFINVKMWLLEPPTPLFPFRGTVWGTVHLREQWRSCLCKETKIISTFTLSLQEQK